MPIYEFACQKCGTLVEEMLKVDQRGPTKCAHCGGRMKRVISRTSFQLKGGGWYKDLYSSSKETGKAGDAPAAKAADEKPAADSAGGAKADKPAASEAPSKTKKAEPSKKADAKKSVA
jgi:putative FmdB family regulatory protein